MIARMHAERHSIIRGRVEKREVWEMEKGPIAKVANREMCQNE